MVATRVLTTGSGPAGAFAGTDHICYLALCFERVAVGESPLTVSRPGSLLFELVSVRFSQNLVPEWHPCDLSAERCWPRCSAAPPSSADWPRRRALRPRPARPGTIWPAVHPSGSATATTA